jgi:hypothetical protein
MVQSEPRKFGKHKFFQKKLPVLLRLKNIIKFKVAVWCREIEEEIRQLIMKIILSDCFR